MLTTKLFVTWPYYLKAIFPLDHRDLPPVPERLRRCGADQHTQLGSENRPVLIGGNSFLVLRLSSFK